MNTGINSFLRIKTCLDEPSPLARLANVVEDHLRDRRHNRRAVHRRYYSRELSQAAAACLIGPYGDALCAIVDDSVEDCRCYLYRNGKFLEINPIGGSPPKFAGSFAADTYDRMSGAVQSAASAAPDTTHGAVRQRSEVFSLTGQMDTSDSTVADVACSTQTEFERRLCALLRNLHVLVRSENLVLTGNCALNSLANGKVLRDTGFKSMYVPCAPSTPGDAIGAALLAYRDDNPESQVNGRAAAQTPYLGSTILSGDLPDGILETGLYEFQACDGTVCTQAASLLSRGLIVAWIQGRAEFCPQSLGNRSILADPRRADLRDCLGRLKPEGADTALPGVSVLHEYGSECIDNYQVSPYMERALQLRPKFVRRVPGLTGADQTVRIQTVRRDWNERFYDLIFHFYTLTGIPMIVNLDCGLPGRRFVRTSEDILSVLAAKEVDVIFVDQLMFWRKHCDPSVGRRYPIRSRKNLEVVQ